MGYGFKVSKAGQNAATASGKNLSFSSEYNSLVVASRGSTTISTNGSGAGTRTVSHGLSYAPSYVTFFEIEPGTDTYYTGMYLDNGASSCTFITTTDSTNITMNIIGGDASSTYDIYYFIFYDQAS